MKLENVKTGDKIRISNGTSEPVSTRTVERVTKTQVICLNKHGEKDAGTFALKFNKVSGRQVGDWTVPYFVVSIVEPIEENDDTETDEYLAFNTGRYYGEHGQRIIAVDHGTGVIFSDLDRKITNYINDCRLDKAEIMRRYDSSKYGEWTTDQRARRQTLDPYKKDTETLYNETIAAQASAASKELFDGGNAAINTLTTGEIVLKRFGNQEPTCPSCGADNAMLRDRDGDVVTNLGIKESLQCRDCGCYVKGDTYIVEAQNIPAPAPVEETNELFGPNLDALVAAHSGFKTFNELVNAKGGYCPTIDCSEPARLLIADRYDGHQLACGDPRRANRYNVTAVVVPTVEGFGEPAPVEPFKIKSDGVFENTGDPRNDRQILVKRDHAFDTGPGLGRDHDRLVKAALLWVAEKAAPVEETEQETHTVFLVNSNQETLRVLKMPASLKVEPVEIFKNNRDAAEIYITFHKDVAEKGAPTRLWFARSQFKTEIVGPQE